MSSFLKKTIEEYLKDLSDRKMVPGGGSASALTAAVGAGLNLMVINYSIKDEADHGFPQLKQEQEESLKNLSSLVDEDCEVFEELMAALSEKRDAQKEYTAAAAVPMKVCRECRISIGITKQLAQGPFNKNLATDIGGAAHFLKAAFYSAKLNVEVNLKYTSDSSFVDDSKKALDVMEKDILK